MSWDAVASWLDRLALPLQAFTGSADAALPVERVRMKWLWFQGLLTAVLMFQVLFILDGHASREMVWGAVLVMLALCGLLLVLPGRLVAAEWFPGLVGAMDLAAITLLMFESGPAGSDLYLAYFALLLIATSRQSPMPMAAFVVFVTVIYGCAPYGRGGEASAGPVVRHVMMMAFLLGLAFVYQRIASEARLADQFDPVTGLPNRRAFLRALSDGMLQGQEGFEQTLLYIDIAGFSRINEAFGHRVSERVLAAVAERAKACLSAADVMARVGPDELAVWLRPNGAPDYASRMAQRICMAMKSPVTVEEREIIAEVCIGIVSGDSKSATPDSLLDYAAAAAVSCAKEGLRGGCVRYSLKSTGRMRDRLLLEHRLYRAVEREEITVHYQPIIHLATHRMAGVEALARWQDPELGLILPETFIPLAEETGLIVPIGETVLRQACGQRKAWAEAGYPALQMAVNLSTRQFHQPDLADRIAVVLGGTGIDPACLNLEVTESCLLKDADAGLRILGGLKALGVQLSIDDFGTGYSSLLALKRFPVDTLKIDRAFIQDMASSPTDAAIVTAILGLAAAMKLAVIAEGVETEAQSAMLRRQECLFAQGYAFSRPVPAEELTAWFAEGRGFEKIVCMAPQPNGCQHASNMRLIR